MAACCIGGVVGGSCANPAIAAGCSVACAFCYDGNNTVETRSEAGNTTELKPIDRLQVGDWVSTLRDDLTSPTWTRLTSTNNVKGEKGFVEITVRDQQSGHEKAVKVTSEHKLVTFDSQRKPVTRIARMFKAGDVLLDGAGKAQYVADVTPYAAEERWVLGTEAGTMLVSGYLTSTMCTDSLDDEEYHAHVSMWRQAHPALP